MEITDSHRTRILAALEKEKIVLFIGAGCSKECGIPDSKTITKTLKSKFEGVDSQNDHFLDVCYDIVETPPYTRNDVLTIMKEELSPKTESSAFNILPKIPWGAIFTTNYDTLIEDSFIKCDDKPYECHVLKGIYPREPIQSRKYTMVYKLMGSIDSNDIEDGGPIITRLESQSSARGTEKYYERLQDAVLDGALIFIGYSLRDIEVIFTLDTLRSKMKDNLPYSYVISPSANSDLQKITKQHERKIIGIEGTFSDFMSFISENIDNLETNNITENEHCKINDTIIPVSKIDFQVHKDEFDLLTEESTEKILISDKKKMVENFFKGKISDWSPYSHNVDFVRDTYYDMWNSIQKELADKKSQSNKLILMHGMPGCGKSSLIKRLGYDIYQKEKLPVFYLKNTGILFENRYLNKVMTYLWEKYTDFQTKPGLGEEVKFTVIIDNFGNHTAQILSLFRQLKSEGKPCLFIVAERSRDLEILNEDYPIDSDYITKVQIPDKLKENEIKRVVKYLHDLNYIDNAGEHWYSTINEIYEKSFFITIYSMVRHSQKPLEAVISDQYLKLAPDIQEIYLYISAIDQFDGDINIELLVRTLSKKYLGFEEELVSAENDGVFFRQELQSGYCVLKTHHKIIAKKTVEFFATDPEKQKEILKRIISNISASSEFEMNLGMYLTIECFGPNAHDDTFNFKQKEELLEAFLEIEDNKAVRHHLGILQKKMGPDRYNDAYSNLVTALKMPHVQIAGRSENDSNILTSLGDLFIKMAMQDHIDEDESRDIIETGEAYLQSSIENDTANIHAYHAHANLLKLKATKCKDEKLSLEYYIEALKQVEIGIGHSSDFDNFKLTNLKTEILKYLRSLDIAEEYADDIFKNKKSTSGYYVLARLLYEEYKISNNKDTVKEGMRICKKALAHDPTAYNILILQFDFIKEIYPHNYQYQHEILAQINKLQMKIPLHLKFTYAYVSFLLEYYPTSRNEFKVLKDLSGSMSVSNRNHIREWLRNENGDKMRLKGEIRKVYNNKYGEIKILNLPGLEWQIPYSPLETKENLLEGTPVWVNLGFSYIGPVAKYPTRRV
ncbi:SIR2 family protein [Methanolobus sp. ZRKC3]|uniref:SIR2 family protein n=1 Tax=Methanolobus sp. ZRKC3 TaxID=3125786 RepID=UPI0032560DC1